MKVRLYFLFVLIGLLVLPQEMAGHTAQAQDKEAVRSVDWSPNGQMLAVSYSSEVRLYTPELELLAVLPFDPEQQSHDLAWSPDSEKLALSTAGIARDEIIYVWDANTNEMLATLSQNQPDAADISWSPDSPLLAATEINHINIWNISTGDLVATLAGHELPASALDIAWHPYDSRLASGGRDYVVRIWDSSTNCQIHVISLTDDVTRVVWSSDGSMLAASTDSEISIWDASNYQLITTLTGFTEDIAQLEWDANRLAVSSWDNMIRIWETDAWSLVEVISIASDATRSFALSPDGTRVAYSGEDKMPEIAYIN